MSTAPDFDAMLAEIMAQSTSPDDQATGSAAAGSSGMQAGSRDSGTGDGIKTVGDISADIAAAVADGCQGMADRRLLRGDIQGAELWSDLAAHHDRDEDAPCS